MDIKKTILSFQVSDKFVTITRVELSVNADFFYINGKLSSYNYVICFRVDSSVLLFIIYA